MPARRVPTAILEARGGYKGHADRKAKRANEPKITTPLGDPPAFMDATQRAEWSSLAGSMSGVLTVADRIAVERVVLLTIESRLPGFSAAKDAELRKWLVELGATPSGRSRISVPGDKPKRSRLDEALSLQ